MKEYFKSPAFFRVLYMSNMVFVYMNLALFVACIIFRNYEPLMTAVPCIFINYLAANMVKPLAYPNSTTSK